MLKAKLMTGLLAAVFSISAQASFIQYNFSNVTFAGGGNLTGYFVENTENKAVAFFELFVTGDSKMHGAQFFPSAQMSNISRASTYFTGAGPTNFSVFNHQDTIDYYLDLSFRSTSTPGTYRVLGNHSQSPLTGPSWLYGEPGSRDITGGVVTVGNINQNLLAYLETGNVSEITTIIPSYSPEPSDQPRPVDLPEPGSLALLALGAATLLGARYKARGNAA